MRLGLQVVRRFSAMAADQLKALEAFNACDISDALLKLKVPKAGFIPDLRLFTPAHTRKVVAPAATVLFAPKSHAGDSYLDVAPNIPGGTHYVDATPPDPGSVVLMSQPAGQSCAVLGGIMALRMQARGAAAIVVGGRVRDLGELRRMEVPVWAAATSTVGAGAESKPWATEIPIEVGGVVVSPGDIVCADPEECGVVVIPRDKLDQVIELCPKLTSADDKVIVDVRGGGKVQDAFKKHRSNI